MDDDTIFPALSSDEQILGKYRDTACRQCVETIAIVTNYRLLIRWKQRLCFCFSHSHYSSIQLDSIARIDETHMNRNKELVGLLACLFIGAVVTILGFVLKTEWFKWIGISLLVSGGIRFLIVFFYYKKKFITVKGLFGMETIRFEKRTARELEAQLSEMIHQRRINNGLVHQNHWHGPSTSASAYAVESKTKQIHA